MLRKCGFTWKASAELPAVSTLITQNKCGHWLISTACLHLVVGAVLLPALAALQQVGGGATSLGHLVFPDGLLGENVPQLFQLVAGHFLRRHGGDAA